jgi:hypothetical protein
MNDKMLGKCNISDRRQNKILWPQPRQMPSRMQ